jgi:uncharacterized protein (TIGR02996 family)
MDATREMLVQAIVEDPEADDLRLIYADWLQDHGEPERAEFIRVQVRLATLDEDDPEYQDDPEYRVLHWREQDLLAEYSRRWLADLPAEYFLDKFMEKAEFHRGFPEILRLKCRTFLAAAEITQKVTPIAQLFLDGVDPAAELADCPALANVRDLTLWGSGTPEEFAVFLRSRFLRLNSLYAGGEQPAIAEVVARWPGVASLRSLRLAGDNLGQRGIAALAASPYLTGLRRLDLSGCPLGTAALRELVCWTQLPTGIELGLSFISPIERQGMNLLAGWPPVAGIETLNPTGMGMGELAALPELPRLRNMYAESKQINPAAAQALASLPQLRTLRLLWLKHNPLGNEGLRRLTSAQHFGAVRHLDLDDTQVGDDGLIAMAAAPALRPVRLILEHNPFSARGVEALASSPVLERVEDLDLSRARIGDAGLVALARGGGLRWPRRLGLSQCGLNAEGVIALSGASWASELRELELSTNTIGDRAGAVLVGSPILAHLHTLEMGSAEIGDESMVALASSPSAVHLRKLFVSYNRITDVGARALLTSPYLEHIDTMNLWSNAISRPVLEALWERFGDRVYPQHRQLPPGKGATL